MKATTYKLKLVTPCFCAGANQARAELRASSFRGQIRWWFRALGGTSEDERAVFGGVTGSALASSIVVRVCDVKPGKAWTPPEPLNLNSNSYVYYFARESGAAGKGLKRPRWDRNAVIPPSTTFGLQIIQKRSLAHGQQKLFDLALNCFLQLGAIGLRVSRGLGAFVCDEVPFSHELPNVLAARNFSCELRAKSWDNPERIIDEIGSLVKGTRHALRMGSDKVTPFGSAKPRQTSAIYFRPVLLSREHGTYGLVVFEAPHERVIEKTSTPLRIVVGKHPSLLVNAHG